MNNPRRLTTALLVALLFSGGFTYLLSRRMQHQAERQMAETIRYVAPIRALKPGEVLRVDDLHLIAWPAGSPVQGGVTTITEAVGRASIYPLDPGQPVRDRELTARGADPGLASRIPDGMRAIALRTDEVVGVAGFLVPGSHLDVLVTYRMAQSPDPVTAIVLENAEVVAAGHQVEPEPEGKAASATVVTLLLTPQQAERAVLASTQGTVHFILRNGVDRGQSDAPPISLSQLGSTPAVKSGPGTSSHRSPRPTAQPFQIETVLGDQAGAGQPTRSTQP